MEEYFNQQSGGEMRINPPENDQLLEALISNSFDAIIVIDLQRKIIKFNHQAEKLLGYSESEMIGQSVAQIYEDKTKAREIYHAINSFGEVERADIVLLRKDGSNIPVSFSGKLILNKEGKTLGQVGYLNDPSKIQLSETRLRALIETSKAVNRIFEKKEIFEHIVRSALQAIPAANRGSIHLYNEQSGKLELIVASYNYSQKAWGALGFRMGEGIAGWVFERQEPVNSRNALVDERYKLIDNPEVKPHRSLLSAPITGKSRAIGVISLSNTDIMDAFTAADLDLLCGFADQSAVAFENADLIASTRKEADDLEFLRTIGLKINAKVNNLTEILNLIVESGNKLLGTEMAVIHWKEKRKDKLITFVAPPELKNLMTEPRLSEGIDTPDQTAGLTAEVFRSEKPVIIPDTSQDTRVNPLVRDVGIQSLVGLQLQLHGQVAGALFFNSRHRQFFGERQIHLISLLLPQAAVAIETATIFERIEHARRLSEALVGVSSQLAAALSLDDQLAALKHFLQVEMAVPMFYLGLYDKVNSRIELKISCEGSNDLELFNIPVQEDQEWTISSFVVKNRKPLLWFSQEEKEKECRRLGINPLTIGVQCKTCLAFPLEVEQEILGVFSIQSDEAYAWDEIEVSTFRTLALQTSIAVRNAKLHKQINKARNTAMQVAEMTALGDLEKTLDSIVNGVKDVLGCDIVTLWTYRQEKDQFDPRPAWAGKLNFPAELSQTETVGHDATPYKIIGMEDIYVASQTRIDPILKSPFAQREDVRSSIAAPLKTHDRRVGVLFINYCGESHTFTEEELFNTRLYSSQAAVALRNAMLFQDEQKRIRVLNVINEAGRIVTSFLQLDEIFENLARQALILTGQKGEIASFATITLVEGNRTVLQASYPPENAQSIMGAKMGTIDLDRGLNGRIGIVGRAVKSKIPLLIEDIRNHPDYLRANPKTKCELAVPIIYQNEVKGVINVEHEKIGGLDEDDLRDIQSLAAHAAVAIQNARMYQALQRKSRHQQAIYEASKIINASLERTQKELLDLLVGQMVTKIVPKEDALNILGAIHIFDPATQSLKLESTHPKEAFLPRRIGESRPLIDPPEGRIGISGRAALTRKPQLVPDITQDPDYLIYSESTKSELDVPMFAGEQVLGVLSLECDQLNGFDRDSQDALLAFAELAVIAIQNTRRYRELKETRATVGNITAVAWMGLVAAAWRHTIGNMATTISDLSLLAEKDLEKGKPPEKISLRMNKIRKIVEEIQDIPMPPLSSESGIEPVNVCQLVRDRINQFRSKKERYGGIEFQLDFENDDLLMVRASPEWLRRVLDILIDNASNAMKESPLKQITTQVKLHNDGVEILVSDTGPGIPDHIRPKLFNHPIEKKKGEKGSGIGLFIANTIIQVYAGRLEIGSSSPQGTTMVIWLPLLK